MTSENHAAAQFDEQAALAELERLQRAIEESRRRRGETVDEFNAFVRSFAKSRVAEMEAEQAASAVAPPVVRETVVSSSPLHESPQASEAIDPIPFVAKRRVGPATWLVIGGAIVTIGISAKLLRVGHAPSAEPSPGAAPAETPHESQPASVAAATRAPAPPPVKGGLQAEIVTLRPVWVRVLADGQRAIERELKANERIPVHANQTLAIRAGDAGALRISIGGQDQGPLGRDGIVANRTFTARPAQPPR
jgi:Domain of unknown function (DUF4115)